MAVEFKFNDDFRRRMLRLALTITHNHADAESAVSDVQLKILERGSSILRGVNDSEAFVTRMVRTRAIDYLRMRKGRKETVSGSDWDIPAPPPPDQDEGALAVLARALDLLTPADRAVIDVVIAVVRENEESNDDSPSALSSRIIDTLEAQFAADTHRPSRESIKTRLSRARAHLDILIHLLTLADSPDTLGHLNLLLWQGDLDLVDFRRGLERVALPRSVSLELESFLALDTHLHGAYERQDPKARGWITAKLVEPQDDILNRKHSASPCRKNKVAAAIDPAKDIKYFRYHLCEAHRRLLNSFPSPSGRR
jgi:Sigma-70 region 2